MTRVKTFLIVSLAAMVMSVAIASSASAVKVCSTAGTGASCEGTLGKEYTGAFSASLTLNKSITLTSGFIRWQCSVSSIAGSFTVADPATGFVSSLGFASCNSDLGACTFETNSSAITKWHVAANSGNTITSTHNPMRVAFNCGGAICKYYANDATVTVDNSYWIGFTHIKAKLTASVPLALEIGNSGFCASTVIW